METAEGTGGGGDVGLEGGDTGGGDTGDTGGAPSSPGAFAADPTPEGGGTEGKSAATPKAADAPAMHKYRFGGEDREGSLEDIQKLLNDDYEHELTVDGKAVRATNAEMRDNYQLRSASYGRLEQAKRLTAEHDSRLSVGKEDPMAYMAEHFGIDVDKFAHEHAKSLVQLDLMRESNPDGYIQGRQEMDARFGALRQKFDQRQQQEQERQAYVAQKRGEFKESLPKLFEAVGLEASPMHEYMLVNHLQEAGRVDHQLDHATAAGYVARDVQGLVHKQLEGMDGAALMKYLPESVIESIRQAQVAAVTGRDPAKPRPAATPATPAEDGGKAMSAQEWLNGPYSA